MAELLGGQLQDLDQAERDAVLRILRRQARRSFKDLAAELQLWIEGMDELDPNQAISLPQHIISSAHK